MQNFHKKIFLIVPLYFAVFAFFFWLRDTRVTLHTDYGKIEITQPVLVDLLNSSALQRLKGINQLGVSRYVRDEFFWSRYDHSIGVFALLHRFGASLEEQIAGLLHDVSHTVFSHVGDFVFQHNSLKSSYQDEIHEWFLEKSGVASILKKHGYSVRDIMHKNQDFYRLERDLPDLCVDRLEYNLKEGVLRGLVNKKEVNQILSDLRFDDARNVWVFKTIKSAKKFAQLPLHFTEHSWGAPWNVLAYRWTSDALRRAIDIRLLSVDDIHFSVDDVVWHKLQSSDDELVQKYLQKMLSVDQQFDLAKSVAESDQVLKPKFRGINPFVEVTSTSTDHTVTIKRLSEVDKDFAGTYRAIRKKILRGWYVAFTQEPEPSYVETTTMQPDQDSKIVLAHV